MANLVVYDINSFIKNDSTITSLAGGQIVIMPLVATENCNATYTGSPLIRYYWMPGLYSTNNYWTRRDRIKYYVMDRDIDRLFQVTDRMVRILDAQGVPLPKIPCLDNTHRIDWTGLMTSASIHPKEVNGLAQEMLEFEVHYLG